LLDRVTLQSQGNHLITKTIRLFPLASHNYNILCAKKPGVALQKLIIKGSSPNHLSTSNYEKRRKGNSLHVTFK